MSPVERRNMPARPASALRSLIAPDPEAEPPLQVVTTQLGPTRVPWRTVAPNPVVKRLAHGDVEDLAADFRARGQIQACVVVSKAKFLGLYPEHADEVEPYDFVVCVGTRRRLAAEACDVDVKITVEDDRAESRAKFRGDAIAENDGDLRKPFDPIEEAEQLRELVKDCDGSYDRVLALLPTARSKGYISQRIALTTLVDDLKTLVRTGQMPLEAGRSIGRLPEGEQVRAWEERTAEAERAKAAKAATKTPRGQRRPAPATEHSRPAFTVQPDVSMPDLAKLLRERLGESELRQLTRELMGAYGTA